MPAPKYIKAKSTKQLEPTKQILELAKKQLQVRVKLEKLKQQTSLAQEEYDNIRMNLLPAAMEAVGIDSFKGKSGGACFLRNKTHVNVNNKDQKKLFAWLKKIGADSLIKPQVNHNSLQAFVKDEITQGNKLPTFIKTYDQIVAVVTGGKSHE